MLDIPGMSRDDLLALRAGSPDCPYRSQIATPTNLSPAPAPEFSFFPREAARRIILTERLFSESPRGTHNSERGPPTPVNS
jgi:hypothetical protein